MTKREEARRLARESIQRGDPVGWFEELYRRAGSDFARVPWADLVPNPFLLEWLASPAARERRARGRCLVVGCGFGDDAEALAAAGYEVTAFDVSPTAVAGCRARFPGSAVRYAVADVLAPPRAWALAFDLVFEAYTLQVLPPDTRKAAVRALAGCAAPGGQVLVVCRAREPEEPTGELPWPITREELDGFRAAGLVELSCESGFDAETPPVRRFLALYERPGGDRAGR